MAWMDQAPLSHGGHYAPAISRPRGGVEEATLRRLPIGYRLGEQWLARAWLIVATGGEVTNRSL
jgi:hypothetical protein